MGESGGGNGGGGNGGGANGCGCTGGTGNGGGGTTGGGGNAGMGLPSVEAAVAEDELCVGSGGGAGPASGSTPASGVTPDGVCSRELEELEDVIRVAGIAKDLVGLSFSQHA